MKYNLALVFDRTIHQGILKLATQLQADNECEFKYTPDSIPHATLIKYSADNSPLRSLNGRTFSVVLSGLTLLPSRASEPNAGTWVEISLLIPQELRSLIQDQVVKLEAGNIENDVEELLRPHITICKLASKSNIHIGNLSEDLLRNSNTTAAIDIGQSDAGFSFILD